jgi:hypothetical protein
MENRKYRVNTCQHLCVSNTSTLDKRSVLTVIYKRSVPAVNDCKRQCLWKTGNIMFGTNKISNIDRAYQETVDRDCFCREAKN